MISNMVITKIRLHMNNGTLDKWCKHNKISLPDTIESIDSHIEHYIANVGYSSMNDSHLAYLKVWDDIRNILNNYL